MRCSLFYYLPIFPQGEPLLMDSPRQLKFLGPQALNLIGRSRKQGDRHGSVLNRPIDQLASSLAKLINQSLGP